MEFDQTYTGSFRIDGHYGTFSAQSGCFKGMFMGEPFYGTYEYTSEKTRLLGNFFINDSYTLPKPLSEKYSGTFLVDIGEPYKGIFQSLWNNPRKKNEGYFVVQYSLPEKENMGESWRKLLSKEIVKEYFQEILDLLEKERDKGVIVYPPQELMYSWSNACTVDEVKVVIVGQDPYPSKGQADGLAFSIRPGLMVPKRSSLENIFKAIQYDNEQLLKENPAYSFLPIRSDHGCLISWARQGVLLLNTWLTLQKYGEDCTFEKEHVNSQIKKGWKTFTDQVIKYLSDEKFGLVFMLWGDVAKRKIKLIDEKKHHILQAVHPSPRVTDDEFIRCRHFSKCNRLLEKHGERKIDWNDLKLN